MIVLLLFIHPNVESIFCIIQKNGIWWNLNEFDEISSNLKEFDDVSFNLKEFDDISFNLKEFDDISFNLNSIYFKE